MTKQELVNELKALQKRVKVLEAYESEYKDLQQLFEALFVSSPIGLYILQDGCFIVVSSEFVKITGYRETSSSAPVP